MDMVTSSATMSAISTAAGCQESTLRTGFKEELLQITAEAVDQPFCAEGCSSDLQSQQ
ncbi:MAG: hypothetical protein ABSA46_06150 [Thermodesulfovibrionales bacterium]